jgi:hypothetical protein
MYTAAKKIFDARKTSKSAEKKIEETEKFYAQY